jgi:general secretion pathway protein E
MAFVESLVEIAAASGCSNSVACRSIVQAAAEEQRSFISSILGSKLVDETEFLKGVSRWLEIPWWNEPIAGVPGPLRKKVPAKTALRYHVVPLREDGILGCYDPFDLLARQVLASSLREPIRYTMSTRPQIVQALRQGYGVGAETFEEILEGRSEDELGLELKQETNILDLDDSEASIIKIRQPDFTRSARATGDGYSCRAARRRSSDPLPD